MSVDTFTREQFEAALPVHKDTGEPMWQSLGLRAGEYTYAIPVTGTNKRITIRSSVGRNGVSAETAKNSIRLWAEYFYPKAGEWFALGKLDAWTTRVPGWQRRMTEKLRKLYALALEDSKGRTSGAKDGGQGPTPSLAPEGAGALQQVSATSPGAAAPASQGTEDGSSATSSCGTPSDQSRPSSVPSFLDKSKPADSQSPACPKCGQEMVVRHRRSDGAKFWGCLGFPNCRETRPHFEAVTETAKPFMPSHYQEAIFDFIETGTGHGVVSARAGSGKTTTNIVGLEYTDEDSSVALVAFNRRIAREQARRAPDHVRACTLHSLGFANIRAAWPEMDKDCVDNRKVWSIIFGLRDRTRSLEFAEVLDSDGAVIVKLVSLCKATMKAPTITNLDWIASRYNVNTNGNERYVYVAARLAFYASVAQRDVIDYDDMIYFCASGIVACEKFDFLFVDETQDLNEAQVRFALLSISESGRILAVGDEWQCQPPGTMISLTGGFIKRIEQVWEGDQVVSYYTQKSTFRGTKTQGRRVLATGKRDYVGQLIMIHAGKETTKVTPNHRCLVRMKPGAYYLMYLMIKDNRARIGISRNSHRAGSGLAMRCRQEKADKAWILDMFDTKDEARSAELIAQVRFGLPSLIFKSTKQIHTAQQGFIDGVYAAISPNIDRAINCLREFGRDPDFPAWDVNLANVHLGSKSFMTRACNLISGYMRVRTFENKSRSGRWEVIKLTREHYHGPVYSLAVEATEGGKKLYVADNIVVGNSIYGFRGASVDAMPNLIEKLSATVMPLSISYRCCKAVVRLVNREFPQIDFEAAPNAIEGDVSDITEAAMLNRLQPGDLVLCRTNAPLVEPAFELIRRGVKVVILGRDIGKGLLVLIAKVQKRRRVSGLLDLLEELTKYKRKEAGKLIVAGKAGRAATLRDQVETIVALADGADTVRALQRRIERVFSDDSEGVVFSSVHKAKGGEADRVFILRLDLMPHKLASAAWELQQEENIRYVAYTRAKKNLYFVR